MPVFTFRLDGDIAQRFDAAADSAGGRSVLLPRLVMTAVDAEEGGTQGPVRRRERTTRRSEIRPTALGRAHVCTPVPNAKLVCRLLLTQKTTHTQSNHTTAS